ncbi:MAG: hypothetical protein HDQ88_04450 [Clostridia bacterium]|nr:hypothetical protein [Clostridia bacterium]
MDTCHVFEKPFVLKHVPPGYKPDMARTGIDFYGDAFDTASKNCWFFKHEDGRYYQYGEPTDLVPLTFLDKFGINPERFIGMDYARYGNFATSHETDIKNDPDFQNPDSYVYYIDCVHDGSGTCVPDPEHVVAAVNHALRVRTDLDKCTVRLIEPGFHVSDHDEIPLRTAIDTIARQSTIEDKDVNQVARLRTQAGMSIKNFAEYFGIEYRTIQNWIGNVNKYPEWAIPLFRMKLLADGRI